MPVLRVSERKTAKKERGAEASKARIIAAAVAEFSAKGFDGARLSVIARTADVQAALIHHYFDDKEGLFRAAMQNAIGPMHTEVWNVLGAIDQQLGEMRKAKRRPTAEELRVMIAGFVNLVEHLFQAHGSLFSMLRHEAERDSGAVRELTNQLVRPLFDAAVNNLLEMQKRGEINKAFEARQLCMFVMGAVGFLHSDPALAHGLWPVDHEASARRNARRKELVELVLARVVPA